jgi:HSP20 family molecular chaperone IbpA
MNTCCATQPKEKSMDLETTAAERTQSACCYRPNVDIVERRDDIVLMADMPGVRAKDVDIDFDKGTLTIHGKVRPRPAEHKAFLRQEYGLGDFHRTFQVSQAIDATNIKARMEDGVLVLTLPKSEAVRARKIAVQSSN